MDDKNRTDDDLKGRIKRLEKRLAREKSARRQAEEILETTSIEVYHLNKKMHENARLLEAAIINANDGVIITSADLDSGPRIIYVNDSFTKISGYTSKEIIGKTPRVLQGEKTDRAELDIMRKTLESGQAYKGEIINYHKDGTPYWLDISIVPVRNEEGDTTHFTAIERDITERKHVQQELITQKEKAEAASIAKTDFLATMSHELRTPMNGIIGMCEMILDSDLTPDQRENAETLHGSGESLLAILNDILDISKIEAGELHPEYVPMHTGTAIQQIMQIFVPQANEKNITLKLDRDDKVPSTIISDLARLQQILRNLISNALKFTESGSIAVQLKTIREYDETFLYIAVHDTGIGIPKDKQEAIFEKFTQADTSITRKFGGTGLGLAITRQLVTMLGGEIGVDSAVNMGSIFWFTIPLKIASSELKAVNLYDARTEQNTSEIPEDIKILVVDDHPVNRMFATKLLKKLGFKNMETANDGLEALTMIENKNYDIVLMDCQMPGLDGYEATRTLRIREEETRKHTPIIAITANAMIGDREKCMNAGMDDYLSKPIKSDKLTFLMKKHLLIQDQRRKRRTTEIQNVPFDVFHPPQPSIEKPKTSIKACPIDMEHLNMFTDGNKEEEKELFDLFFEQAMLTIEKLRNSADENDHDKWSSAAHLLKGSAANLGAHDLAKACNLAEQDFECSKTDKHKHLQHIKTALGTIRYYFNMNE